MFRVFRYFLSTVFILAVIGLGLLFVLHAEFDRAGPSTIDANVLLPSGGGLPAIANRLKAAGVLRQPLIFMIGVRLNGRARRLQAGEYRIPAAATPRQLMELLASGETVIRRLTVAEGLTVTEVLDLLMRADGLTGAIEGRPPEGALLPETYHFSHGDSRVELVARMRRNMAQLLAELWPKRQQGLPFKTSGEVLILASIVEKETSIAAERRRVAAVFVNRLRRGMRLQSDPTVVYGVTGGTGPLGRPLNRQDLAQPTVYNTYRIDGLPPTPIANPGRASIEAVLDPLATAELYFVADGSGGHAFAKTLADHNRNVRRWRRLRPKASQ